MSAGRRVRTAGHGARRRPSRPSPCPAARASTTCRCPGGAATGSDAYHVTVEFADVLDLVPQSAVKVNDVTVGAVDAVHLEGWHAEVTLRLARLGEAAGQRRRRAAPDQPARREVRLAVAAPGPGPARPARRGRHHPARPLRPEPRGRGGPLGALPGAQRRRRRPAQDHQRRADQGDAGPRGRHQGRRHAARHVRRRPRPAEGRHRPRARRARPAQRAARGPEGADRQRHRGPRSGAEGPRRPAQAAHRHADRAVRPRARSGTRVVNASRADTVANLRALSPILTKLSDAGDNLPKALRDGRSPTRSRGRRPTASRATTPTCGSRRTSTCGRSCRTSTAARTPACRACRRCRPVCRPACPPALPTSPAHRLGAAALAVGVGARRAAADEHHDRAHGRRRRRRLRRRDLRRRTGRRRPGRTAPTWPS